MKILDSDALKGLIQGVFSTRLDEIDCDACFAELDHFAETYLYGREPAQATALVEDHLKRCKNCREEFEALLAAMKALEQDIGSRDGEMSG